METTIRRTGSQSLGQLECRVWRFLEGVEAADLTIGKPSLFALSESATVSQALAAFKSCKDVDFLSIWVDGSGDELQMKHTGVPQQQCGGRIRDRYRCTAIVSTADIVTFLARDNNLGNLGDALRTPLAALIPDLSQAVEHVHPRTSLYQASEIMLQGVQHLVVPIGKSRRTQKPAHLSAVIPGGNFCWITQEDVVRYMLSSLGSFYPLPMMTLEDLGMIVTDVMTVDADSPAIKAVDLIQRASREKTAVGVVTESCGRTALVGGISTETLRGCDETAATALATLSVRQFLQFIDPSEVQSQLLVQSIVSGLRERFDTARSCSSPDEIHGSPDLPGMAPLGSTSDEEEFSYGSSSDDEHMAGSPTSATAVEAHRLGRCGRHAARQSRSGAAMLTCRPHSTLVAVMAQAVAHRANHVWVTDADGGLVGIVTYADMIDVLLSQLHNSLE